MPTCPAIIQGLRDVAEFLEANPDAELGYAPTFNIFKQTKEEVADFARNYGPVKKEWGETHFCLVKFFSGHVRLECNIRRENVCRKVVTTEVVTRPKTIETGEKETVEIEKVRWVCDEPLLAH